MRDDGDHGEASFAWAGAVDTDWLIRCGTGLSVHLLYRDTVVIAGVRGDVEPSTIDCFHAALDLVFAQAPVQLVIDGGEVSWCSARGLAILVEAGDRARREHIGVAMARLAPTQERLLRRWWPVWRDGDLVHGSLDDALTAVRGHRAHPIPTAAEVLAELTQLQRALATRRSIEQAKGVLMARESCTADKAFALLAAEAGRTRRTVDHVAGALVRSVRQR
jgi:hypothetical protein